MDGGGCAGLGAGAVSEIADLLICREPGCEGKAMAQGLCRTHYDALKRAGKVPKVGTGPRGGRPTGAVRAATPPADEEDYVPSWSEMVDQAKRTAWKILTSEEASQAERNNVLKIVLSGKERGGLDPKKAEELAKMRQAVTGGD